ncbi:MAG TPA: hypothetical protein VJT82_09660 [Pyrinomonadaceae bacterium]|nr:hypothetical protein [Pyrinomonadaceae bacterium]
MSYAIYLIGAVAAGGAALMLFSNLFAYEVSRGLEAAFDFVEYRLALRAKAHANRRREAREMSAVVLPYRTGEARFESKSSTQQLGVARIAA